MSDTTIDVLDAQPTEGERQQAAVRAQMAADEQYALDEAIALLGPGATAYAQWVERDKMGLEPPRVTYCCRRDGHGWTPGAPQDQERLQPPYALGFKNLLTGEHYYPFRRECGFQFIGEVGATYKPKTAEQLAAMRVARERKRVEALAGDMPLLADMVRARELDTKTKNQLNRERREATADISTQRAGTFEDAAEKPKQSDLFT